MDWQWKLWVGKNAGLQPSVSVPGERDVFVLQILIVFYDVAGETVMAPSRGSTYSHGVYICWRQQPSNCTNKGITSTRTNAVKQEDTGSGGVSLETRLNSAGEVWKVRKAFLKEMTSYKESVLSSPLQTWSNWDSEIKGHTQGHWW